MRVLHALIHFDVLSGTSVHVYELSRLLVARGHEVTVVAPDVGGELTARAEAAGIRVAPLGDPPAGAFDLLHLHQPQPGQAALDRWPLVPAVETVHSPWPADRPLRSERIDTFVCVRPEIRTKVVQEDGVTPDRTTVVYNGVDRGRFRPDDGARHEGRKLVLFAGTMGPARRAPALDLLRRSQEENSDIVFIGPGPGEYLRDLPSNATWIDREVWDIEQYVTRCDETAGTFLGRSVIEGWLCAKPARIYEVGPLARVRSSAVHPPPPEPLLAIFDIEFMVDAVERIYRAAVR